MKKLVTPIVSIIIIVAVIFAAKFFMIQFSNPAALVVSIDQEKIFTADEFKQAYKEYESYGKEVYELLSKQSQGLSEAKRNDLLNQYQQQLAQKRAVLLNPLKERAEGAINFVARKNNVKVVLDKQIAVYGIKDVTEEVVEAFKNKKGVKKDDKKGTEKYEGSPIGYFDQDVLRNLKSFREADEKLAKIYSDMQQALKEKGAKATPARREQLIGQYQLEFGKKRAELYGPINEKVVKSVEKIAKDKGLSLVLDKNNVMYGGLNVTDEVVKEFREQTE